MVLERCTGGGLGNWNYSTLGRSFLVQKTFKQDMMASVSDGLVSMGCAVPYAVAGKFAHPGARQTVLDVYTDPNIPPLPPRVTTDQAKAIVSSMLKGDLGRPKPFFDSIGQAFKGIFYK